MPNDEMPDPLDLVGTFSRSSNFPKTKEGIQFLAQGLFKASKASGVAMADLVDRCAELSGFCPTDHDLLRVAEEMRIERVEEKRPKAPLGCEVCQGSGWQSFQRMVSPGGVVPYLADYADFCACARGVWMRQCEKDRKLEAAEKKKKGRFNVNNNQPAA